MVNLASDLGNWLISGISVGAVIAFLWQYIKPVMTNKAEHASTEQSKAMWELLLKVAGTVVTSLESKDIAGSEKFDTATELVKSVMSKQDLPVGDDIAQAAVQAAYEEQIGNKEATDSQPAQEAPVEPKVGLIDSANVNNEVMTSIMKAPNRANLKGDE